MPGCDDNVSPRHNLLESRLNYQTEGRLEESLRRASYISRTSVGSVKRDSLPKESCRRDSNTPAGVHYDIENPAVKHCPDDYSVDQEAAIGKPWKCLLSNLWVFIIALGTLVVILILHSRMEEAEPLLHTHVVSEISPFIQKLQRMPIDYVGVTLVLPPLEGHEEVTGQGGDATHGRRLQSLVRESRPVQWQKAMRQLMESVPDSHASSPLPILQVGLMQMDPLPGSSSHPPGVQPINNGSGYAQYPYEVFHAVTGVKNCQAKKGAAVRCSFDFTKTLSNYQPETPAFLVVKVFHAVEIAVDIHAYELGWLGHAKAWIALGVLVAMLGAIASERVHRMWAAFIAAFCMLGLMMWCGITPDLATVVSWVDESTLALLFGMMIIVGKLRDTGFFEVLCARTLAASGGRLWVLTLMMLYITGFISAFLDNVTTMLLMGPITITMFDSIGRDPVPLLVSQALFSNIGGTATLIGDPPNIIIGNVLKEYLGFMDFIIHLGPGVLFASAPCLAVLLFVYRRHLTGRLENFPLLVKEARMYRIRNWRLFSQCLYVTTVVVVAFLLHPVHHLNPAWVAVIGATLLCVVSSPISVRIMCESVEWDMLLFFAAQFVMVEAMNEVGLIRMIGEFLKSLIVASPPSSRIIVAIQILLWGSAFISAVLDNIPYTITMIPIVEYLAAAGLGLPLQTLAWALAFGACFGGNGTLIGASANIVTASMADKAGKRLTFNMWLYSGVPVMLVSVVVADVYMLLRYAL